MAIGFFHMLVVALILLSSLLAFGGAFERVVRDKMGRNDSTTRDD